MDLTRAVVDAKDSCQELTDSRKEMSDSCQELADSYKSLQAMAADLLSSWERFKVQQAAATSSRTTTTTPPPTSTTPPPTTTTTPPPTSTTQPPTPPPQATPTPEEAPASYSIPTMSAVAPHTATAVILQLPTRCSTLGVAHDAGSIDDKVALVEPATVEAWLTIALQFWVQHVPAPARPLVHPRQGPPKNPVPAGDCDSRCFDDNGRLFLTSSFRPSIDAIERGDFSPWKNARYIGRCLPDNLSSLSPGRYKTMRLIELQHLGVTDMGSLWDSIAKNWLVTVIIVARQACDGLKNSTADAIHSITVFFLPHKILELVSSRPPGPPTNCSKRNAFSRVNNGWQSMHLVMNNFLLWRHIDFILKEVGVFAIQVQSMAAILMRPWDPGVVDLFSMNILLVHWNILRADSKPEIQVTSWCSITCSEWPSPNSCFQYYFQNVHVQRYGHVTSIRAPSATCCFCLLHVAAKQWTNLQKMQPIGVQIALLLHLLVPLQQNHGGWVLLRRILPTAQELLHGTIGVERVSVTGSYLAMIAACFLYAEIMQSNASSREHVVATHNKLNDMVLCGMPKEESCICARASVQLIGQSGDVSRIRPNLRRPFVPEFLCIKLQEGQLTSDQINGSLMIMPAPEANDVNALDNSEFNSFLSARPANHLHGSAIAICPRAIPNNCQQHLMVTSFNVPWFSVYGFLQFGKLHVIMIWDPDIKKCFMGIPYYPGNTIGVCPSACRANVVQQYMTSYHLYTWASYITHQALGRWKPGHMSSCI